RISRGEDLDMWFRLMKYNNLVKTNRITAIYRIDAENRSNKSNYDIKKSFLNYLNFKDSSKAEKVYLRNRIYKAIKIFIRRGDLRNCFYLIRKYYLNGR